MWTRPKWAWRRNIRARRADAAAVINAAGPFDTACFTDTSERADYCHLCGSIIGWLQAALSRYRPIMKLSTNNSILANRSSGGSNKHESTKKPTREVNNKSAFFNSPIFYLPLVLNVVCVISSGSRRPVRSGSRTRSKTNIVKKLPQAENIGPQGSCECVKN